MAVFFLGENMVEYGSICTWERCFKAVFRFVVGAILKRAFCLEFRIC